MVQALADWSLLLIYCRYFYYILLASFSEHVNLLKIHFLGYVNLGVRFEMFVSTRLN